MIGTASCIGNNKAILVDMHRADTRYESVLRFVRQLFQTLALGFRDKQSGENPSQHEKGENFEDVVKEFIWTVDISQAGEADLRDDSAKLAACRRDTVCRGAVTGGEDLPRHDEGGSVGAKVLEKVGETVKEGEPLGVGMGFGQCIIAEAHDNEKNGEDGEAHQLNRFTSLRVDKEECHPVTWDETPDR